MIKDLQNGFSLIEILVSVFVLSLGLLGLAALQLSSLKYNHEGYLRSIAIAQANNMADRMRANKSGVSAGYYNNLDNSVGNPGCSTCSSLQLASYDAYQWNQTYTAYLPTGQGTVVANGNYLTITVRWDNDRTGATGTACSDNHAVDLTCYSMDVRI